MSRKNLTRLVAGTVIAVAFLAVQVSEAQAFRHWSASSSSGSWGSSSSSSGSWGSSSSGSSGGWLARHSHYKGYRRARWHSSGSWGSSSSSSGSWGSSSSGSSGTWMPATPNAPDAPAENGAYYRSNSGTLTVTVPADAKVFVNDMATKSEGLNRRYVSRGLVPGRTYTYTVRVEFERDGQQVSETKTAQLLTGSTVELVFDSAASGDIEQVDDTPVDTKLTLNVPANAKVFLAGNLTKMTGLTRTYTTQKLSAGQDWPGYVVRVAIERNGRTVAQERVITLNAGQQHELSFDFDTDKLASAAR